MNSKRKISIGTHTIIGFLIAFFAVASSLTNIIIPIGMIKSALIGILFVLTLIKTIGKPIYKKDGIYLILVLYMIVFLSFRSAWSIHDILLFSSCLFLCLLSCRNRRWIKPTLHIMGMGYLFYAVATIFLYFNRSIYMSYVVDLFPATKARLIAWYNNGYMAGLTNHYSTNAMLLATGMLLFGVRFLNNIQSKERSRSIRKQRRYLLISFVLLLVSLLLTAKRAHIIFVAAAFFVIYYFSTSDQKASGRFIKIVGFMLGFLVAGTIVLSCVPALSGFITRFQETMDSGDIAMGRYVLWEYAISAFKKNWLLGIGWHQFAPTLSIAYNGIKVYDVHNIYLQLLCETGIVGFSVYISWMANFLYRAIKNYKFIVKMKADGMQFDKTVLAFSLGFQIFFLLYGFTGNPLYDQEMYIPYLISCAITMFYSHNLVGMSKD